MQPDAAQATLLRRIVARMEAAGFVTDVLSCGESKFMGVCILARSHPYSPPDHVRRFRRIDIRVIPHDQARCLLTVQA